MTDAELIAGFEDATLEEFSHAAHVRVAWWYVAHEPLLLAIARMRAGLRRFAAAKGKPERYHETITNAFLLLVADRWRDGETWDAFAARNPDLLQWPCPALERLYGKELDTARAREVFVAPRGLASRESAPLCSSAPDRLETTQRSISFPPAITTPDVDFLPGAPMTVAGTSAGKGDVYEPGVGGVSDPKLIREVKPGFTADAMRATIQGVVVMEVVVLADGTVDPSRIRITRSLDRDHDQHAVIAVSQWRFRPSERLGKPVASRVTVELAFTLR